MKVDHVSHATVMSRCGARVFAPRSRLFAIAITVFVMGINVGSAQFGAAKKSAEVPPSTLIEIAEEPKTIDPATLLPESLAAKVTVDMSGKSLRELVTWLRTECGLTVEIDVAAFNEEKILLGDPYSDKSADAPLYLLLNRLDRYRLAWHYRDGTLYLTTAAEVGKPRHQYNVNYVIGDLLDQGHDSAQLMRLVEHLVEAKSTADTDASRSVLQLGDVLFVRQSDAIHQQILGTFAALRKHGRRTYVLDPSEHAELRESLQKVVTVNFQDVPLLVAIQSIANLAEVDLRLDSSTLATEGIRFRMPVNLQLEAQPLERVLRTLVNPLKLTWMIDDNVLWVTSAEQKQKRTSKCAVYDVRDLCRDQEESESLLSAVRQQTRGPWSEDDGEGGTLLATKPGVMVLIHSESQHDEVLTLLENYRAALRVSKPRNRGPVQDEVLTRYYRLPTEMATNLTTALPELVAPETWRNATRPDAVGAIQIVASRPEVLAANASPAAKSTTAPQLASYSTLVIRQTRETHQRIEEVLQRLEHGDAPLSLEGLRGGFGGGGGGFGGGFFSIPRQPDAK